MFLWRLFFTNPILAIALCICMAGILWCILILRKQKKGPDRFLAAMIGTICIAEGMRVLQLTGFISIGGTITLNSFAELMITALYLIAVLILRMAVLEHKSAEVRLRLSEASEQQRLPLVALEQPDESVKDIILGSNPLATIALDKSDAVIYWNSAAERLLGWRAGDVIGKASPSSLSSPIRTKSGSQVRVEFWISAIHDAAGRPCGTVYLLAPLAAPSAAPEPKTVACDQPALAC